MLGNCSKMDRDSTCIQGWEIHVWTRHAEGRCECVCWGFISLVPQMERVLFARPKWNAHMKTGKWSYIHMRNSEDNIHRAIPIGLLNKACINYTSVSPDLYWWAWISRLFQCAFVWSSQFTHRPQRWMVTVCTHAKLCLLSPRWGWVSVWGPGLSYSPNPSPQTPWSDGHCSSDCVQLGWLQDQGQANLMTAVCGW